MVAIEPSERHLPERPTTQLIRRHSIVTRLTHWLNVLCLSMLLMSGLQIFNAYAYGVGSAQARFRNSDDPERPSGRRIGSWQHSTSHALNGIELSTL